MEDALTVRRHKLRRLLRAMRRERGVTQAQVAEHLGVPQSVISKCERGERQLEAAELIGVCEALGISLRTFVRRWESTPDDFEGE